ncbi:hypothetical protein SpCBS45565_g06739 [Spizellomyces sp. 'palustris']|nr:hypothetical protein SpCBS45565_g06739 [Spizellomyces sp. 'palustris']
MSASPSIPVVPHWKEFVKRGVSWQDWRATLDSTKEELDGWTRRTDLDGHTTALVKRRSSSLAKAISLNYGTWKEAENLQVLNTRLLLEVQRTSLPAFAESYLTTARGVFGLGEGKRAATTPPPTEDHKRPRLLDATEISSEEDGEDLDETGTDEVEGQELEIPGLEDVLQGSDITLPNDVRLINTPS